MAAVLASILSALTGRPVDAERWADAVDRWQYGDPAQPGDPSTQAWTALLRAILCRRGIGQMRADADEAVRRFAEQNIPAANAVLVQGIARVVAGDLDGGDASLADAASVAEQAGQAEEMAMALCERALLSIARRDWDQAEVLAGQARTALNRARLQEGYVTPLVCAVHARAALHRGNLPAAHRSLLALNGCDPC